MNDVLDRAFGPMTQEKWLDWDRATYELLGRLRWFRAETEPFRLTEEAA
jgi:hypothetical protein